MKTKTFNYNSTKSHLLTLFMSLPLLLAAGLIFVRPCAAATFQFERTGNLRIGRDYYTATLLQSGQVLAAAGYSVTGRLAIASAELYDPTTGTWRTTGALH